MVIQFRVAEGQRTSAGEAVVHLKRGLLPQNTRSRRNVDAAPQLLRFRLDNQTTTATAIYNWTGALSSNSRRFLTRSTQLMLY